MAASSTRGSAACARYGGRHVESNPVQQERVADRDHPVAERATRLEERASVPVALLRVGGEATHADGPAIGCQAVKEAACMLRRGSAAGLLDRVEHLVDGPLLHHLALTHHQNCFLPLHLHRLLSPIRTC